MAINRCCGQPGRARTRMGYDAAGRGARVCIVPWREYAESSWCADADQQTGSVARIVAGLEVAAAVVLRKGQLVVDLRGMTMRRHRECQENKRIQVDHPIMAK